MPKPYARPTARESAADPQRFRLYRMENEQIGARNYLELSRKNLGSYVRSMARAYRVPMPKLAFKNLGPWAAEYQNPNLMTFGYKRTSRDLLTAAHEFAHHLHYWLTHGGSEIQEDHGPEFMSCYMSILDTSRFIPVEGMRAICDKHGIRYIDFKGWNDVDKLQKAIYGRRSA